MQRKTRTTEDERRKSLLRAYERRCPRPAGDVAYLHLPQARAAGEAEPPLSTPHLRVSLPAYANEFALIEPERMPDAEVHIWHSPAMVVADSCELDRLFDVVMLRMTFEDADPQVVASAD